MQTITAGAADNSRTRFALEGGRVGTVALRAKGVLGRPIFFDPDADEPRPRELGTVTRELTEGLRQAGRETGVDSALIEAWCELGYVVTEDNRHLFSAGDIAVWEVVVHHHADNFDDDDLDDEDMPDEDLH